MRYAILISIIVLFSSSCADNSKNDFTVYKAADDGLNLSTETISSLTHSLYCSLENKLAEYYHNKSVEYWQPKALQVKTYCQDFYQYIDALKTELKNKTGMHVASGIESYEEGNVAAVNTMFEKKGKELYEKLIGFRKNVLAVDTQVNLEFEHPLLLFTKGFDYTKQDSKAFTKIFFNNIPAIAAILMLSKLENNIRINEYNLIGFCHSQASPVIIHDDFPEPLITQSSKYVKAGEEIQITAGIGIYTTAMKRKIVINNTVISLENEPIGFYKLKASTYRGKHIVPITIEFIQPDGAALKMQKNIEYIVIDTTK